MSGFGGAQHSVIGNLFRQLQDQGWSPDGTSSEGGATPMAGTPTPSFPGVGPGEPQNFNYGGMGMYNTLAQDMSRNMLGPYSFNQGMFGYQPFGDPYAQPPVPPTAPPGDPPPPDIQDPRDFWQRPGMREQNRFARWRDQPQQLPAQQQGPANQMGGAATWMGGGLQGTRGLQQRMMQTHGYGAFPGYGMGGMPGYGGPMARQGYGGMFGGSGYGMSGGYAARPWRGPQSGGMYGKPYNYGGGPWGGMATTQPVMMY